MVTSHICGDVLPQCSILRAVKFYGGIGVIKPINCKYKLMQFLYIPTPYLLTVQDFLLQKRYFIDCY